MSETYVRLGDEVAGCPITGCHGKHAHAGAHTFGTVTADWPTSTAQFVERLDVELDIRERVEQAILEFGRGTDGKRVHREAIRTFKGLVGAGIRYALKQNSPKAFEEKWGEAMLWFRSVGELSALGRAVVGSDAVAEAWQTAKSLKGGGNTDFCHEGPGGGE